MMERHEVRRDGVTIGWVGYETASDLWYDAVFPVAADVVRGEWRTCDAPPDVDGRVPHALQLVTLRDRYDQSAEDDGYGPFLFCPTCSALVSPPHDGYAYGDYPESWLGKARP